MSEFINSFLKLLGRKNSSYVKDATDFLYKVSKIQNSPEIEKSKPILDSMDVQLLHPNLNHKECTEACKTLLDKRNNWAIPTNWLTKLIQLIFKRNTMIFNGHYFHQIKGTAIGTPKAVSYVNIFLSVFESNMLLEYQNKYTCKWTSWLRFIHVFFYLDRGWEISETFP